MATYDNLSPYYLTTVNGGYLDVMTWREIPAEADDILYTIHKSYENRPDLLAHDLYGDVKLWWVFSMRNPSKIKDPIFDMVSGTSIYLPKLSSIKITLGI
jgi:hypothetical protein